MKIKNIFLSALLVGASCGYSQEVPQTQVPSLVVNAFAQQFNNPNDVEWEMQGGNYEAEFEIGDMDHEVWFDNSGKILRHERKYIEILCPQP